ncbi:hypothetical protein F66182_7682 [Fusarium sp. NRRL 66182]|nr:hypothetical protein F66182_7682 [Fusarium sp. NRRL 66182]
MYPHHFNNTSNASFVADTNTHNSFLHQNNSFLVQQAPFPPPLATNATLSPSRPVLLPATSIGSSLDTAPPFVRAYPPILGSYDISATVFLSILDALNVALADPAACQAVGIAGEGLGFVPNEIAQGAALGLEVAAGASSAAVCYIRTKRLLDKMNREVFNPKGLHMEIKKDEVIMETLGCTARSIDPLERLRELGPYVETLSFDVEPPVKQTNVLDRISAKQTAMKLSEKEKEKQKKLAKREQKREKAAEKYNRPLDSIDQNYNSGAESLLEMEAKSEKLDNKINDINTKADIKLDGASPSKTKEIEKRRSKDLAGVEKERARLLEKRDKAVSKIQKKAEEKQEEDKKKVAKLEWLVIRNV